MKGSIVQRNDHLYVIVRPRDAATGKTLRIWRAVPRAKGMGKRAYQQAAERLLHELCSEYDQRGYIRRDGRTNLSAHLDAWLRVKAASGRAPSTLDNYRTQIERRIKPALGGMPLAAVQPATVRDFLLSDHATRLLVPTKEADGTRSWAPTGKPAATRTPALLHAILYGALEDAVRLELVARNPVRQIAPPKSTPKREPHPLTEDEAAEFLRAAEAIGSRYATLYRVALSTGLRVRNLTALQWQDVDLESGRILVRKAKTKASEQALPIGPDTVASLRKHRRRLAEEKLSAGPAWPNEPWVWPNTLGHRADYAQLRRRDLPRVAQAADLGTVRMHDLRRTAGTLMLGRGVPPQVAASRLGHKSEAFFLRTYAFALPSAHAQAADVMDDVLAGRPAKPAQKTNRRVE